MKKSHYLIIAVFLGLTVVLSACVPGPRVVGTPGISLSDEMVYVSHGSFVYGLDVESGSIQWHYPEEANNQVVFYAPPLVTDEFIYVGDLANNFHKLDKDTGEVEWTFSGSKGYYIGKAAEVDGIVYAPSNDGNLYAIDSEGNLLWSFKTGHYIWAQPQVSDDVIFLASMDHNVYALSSQGDLLWTYEMAGAIVGSPLLSEDGYTLFAASMGKEMVALDIRTGVNLWTFDAGGSLNSVWGNAILVEGLLIFADSDGQLFALDPGNGQPEWQTTAAGSVVGGLAIMADGFVLASDQGTLQAFNLDGSSKWESNLQGEIFQAPVVNDEILVAGTINNDSLVHAFNLTGVQIWSTTPEN